MDWMVAAFFFWILHQFAKSHPLTKPFTVKSSEKWKSPMEVVYPKLHLPPYRRKRSTKSDDHPFLVLRTTNDTFYIRLTPNEDLQTHHPKTQKKNFKEPCHYYGTLLSNHRGSAAVSVCGGRNKMSGVIVTAEDTFIVRPVDHLKREGVADVQLNDTLPGAHVIVKMDPSIYQYCGGEHKAVPESVPSSLGLPRVKRAAPDTRKIIETAVYVDYPLYHKLSVKRQQPLEELKDTVLAILNEVQLIYNYQSLRTKFKIVVVKLEILSEGKEAPDAADGDIDQYLDNFCSWQSSKNPPANSELHWDHALMMTGYDLHKVTPGNEKNKKVLGLAWVNGMCRPKHSCTLNEGSSFEAAFVIAHEMGHSLGMMHDGRGNDCDPSAFLMSEKTGPGRITWSTCSNDYLDRFFLKGYGSCLENDNSYALDDVSQDFFEKLPGEKFNLEEQCKLSLGEEFKPHVVPKAPFNNVCRELWCVSGLWASVAHPALEGSSCGNGKHCMQGKCREVSAPALTSSPSPSNAEIVEDMKGAVADFLDKLKSAFQLLLAS